MTDLELSELAKAAMLAGEYDEALAHLRKMQNKIISLKMELLVLEREAHYSKSEGV